MRFVLSLLSVLTLAIPAVAQQPAQPQPDMPPEIIRLKAYVNTQDYVATVVRLALEGEKDIAPECPQPKPLDRRGFLVMRMPTWGEGPHPTAGMWKDEIKVDRCGKVVIHNVLFVAQANGLPEIGLLLPGETTLSPRLQRLVLADVAKAASQRLKCKEVDKTVVSDTRFDKVMVPPKKNAQGVVVAGKWREEWIARACGKTAPVTIEFTADGQGAATHKIVK